MNQPIPLVVPAETAARYDMRDGDIVTLDKYVGDQTWPYLEVDPMTMRPGERHQQFVVRVEKEAKK